MATLEERWMAPIDDEPSAPPTDTRMLRVGLGFFIAALLVALMPLFKPAPKPVVAAPAAIAKAVPSRLQPPDFHAAKPVVVAQVAKPAAKKAAAPAKKRHVSKPLARN